MDNCSCLAVSSKSESEVLSDLPTGSTAIHPRPEIAKSHAGLHKHKLVNFWSMHTEKQNLVIITISKIIETCRYLQILFAVGALFQALTSLLLSVFQLVVSKELQVLSASIRFKAPVTQYRNMTTKGDINGSKNIVELVGFYVGRRKEGATWI